MATAAPSHETPWQGMDGVFYYSRAQENREVAAGGQMSLWNPRKPLNQPPHFGRVGAVIAHTNPVVCQAERTAINAEYDAKVSRRKRSTTSMFDRSTKGSR